MNSNEKIQFKSTFDYKVIYAFTIDDDKHNGLIKIGDATLHTNTLTDSLYPNCHELNQAAMSRIKEYTNTVGVTPILLHTELAVKTVKDKDGTMKLNAFRDYEVHRVLENSGIKKAKFDKSTGREWYKIDKKIAIEAINAVKKNYANLSNSTDNKFMPIIFRPEQKTAIALTLKQFKKGNRMLWNAKMRFGKTLSALEVIKQSKYNKTIILTHRPVVNAGWYEDFTKIFHDMDYLYGSKVNGYTVDDLLKKNKHFVYFASIQDLRGSETVGGKFNKNETIFTTIWDFVIVDEAHEGTKTALGDETIKAILKEELHMTKFLALSGTPFNIMDQYDKDFIYTWDYIMEQECKSEWVKQNFGDSNPYDELPELRIYTYNLGDILHNNSYITYEDKAFNFHEFFLTWTGDYKFDYAQMPQGANIGNFVHEQDVLSFLNLMTKEDEDSTYPYSRDEYRKLFKHSLWMVPGVREAKALKNLMIKHPVFGNGQFNIVNVAGSDDEESSNALYSVKNAIKEAEKIDTYTITLSCGKLTTGVTVKEWTSVFMLSGSFSTSAANYLQTIFRVQSPCNKNGKIKETAYVFDFAPDRTLKMVSEAVSVSSKVGKTNDGDKKILGKFLNYCPVISISGSQMKEYNADKLLQQLKKAYADKVVKNGFDDTNLYNDELFKLQDVDIKKFDKLKGIIGKSKAASKQNDININDQGLTNEEYEETQKLGKKPKKELTEEEKARLEELKKKKKVRKDAISILRGISIRMPLLIYGADIPYNEEITLEHFVEKIDDSSWNEFMPTGVTKEMFNEFKIYYDEDVFIAAGRRIRNIAREADTLNPTERVKKIAGLFSHFKNPDKETVLTPWRVVNMHMSDCLGGYDFFDKKHEGTLDEPRYVDQGQVTTDTFGNEKTQILEINSKTGLYPLYVTYSIYRTKCKKYSEDDLTLDIQREVWNDTIKRNTFVICKTPMAKQITQRTLAGYTEIKINAHYFDDLINAMKNKPQQFVDRILRQSYWKNGGLKKMKFDAVVGNPPYQEIDNNSTKGSAKPLYHNFIKSSISLSPHYLSLITPSVWFTGGKGLDEFRRQMLNEIRLQKIVNYTTPQDVFTNVNLRGGVNYFLWNKEYDNSNYGFTMTNIANGEKQTEVNRPLCLDGIDILIADNYAVDIIQRFLVQKVIDYNNKEKMLYNYISVRNPFGFTTDFKKNANFKSSNKGMKFPIEIYASKGKKGYVEKTLIKKNVSWVPKWKVLTPFANNIGTDLSDDNLNTIISSPDTISTETYLVIGADLNLNLKQCKNVVLYLRTKFVRYLISIVKANQNGTRQTYRFVPSQDFTPNSDIDWNRAISEIDKQLYAKYRLSVDEIAFIDGKIKPMA